jgi:hypothetical protein
MTNEKSFFKKFKKMCSVKKYSKLYYLMIAYRKHRAIQVLMWLTLIHLVNKANIGWPFTKIIMGSVHSLIHSVIFQHFLD